MPNIAFHLNGNGAIFDARINAIMQDAYQRASKSLTAPLSVQKILAEKIFQLTQTGERNPKTLCHEALAFLRMEGDCK